MRTTLHIDDPLLISAPNNGGLLFAHRHLLMPLLHEDATGMAVTPDGLLWCVQTLDEPRLRYVRGGLLDTVKMDREPLDLHDILVDGEDIYAVFTQTNDVVRMDADFRIRQRWNFGSAADSAHVNCIALHNGRLIASMFGGFAEHRGYKGQTRGSGYVVDVESGQKLVEDLSQPHSLMVAGGMLWLCSSEDREMRVYDADFKLHRTLWFPGYTRGLALGPRHLYVGISRSRNLETADVGVFESAAIAVLDRESLQIIGYVPLPWNEIYDIRIAASIETVTDVMAATWQEERRIARAELDDARASWREEKETSRVDLEDARAALHEEKERSRVELDDARAAWREERETVRVELLEARASCQKEIEANCVDLEDMRAAFGQALADAEHRTLELEQSASADLERMMDQCAQLNACIVEMRGDLVKRDARIHELQQAWNELALIKASRSWRVTRPMRFAARVIKHRGLTAEDRLRLTGKVELPFAGNAPHANSDHPEISAADSVGEPDIVRVMLADQSQSRRDVFVWGVIDWHFRIQRPQHLARELAQAGHRVFYMSNIFLDHEDAGFSVESIDGSGRLFQIHLHVSGKPAIYHASPSASALSQQCNGIRQLLAWIRSTRCLSIVQHPYWIETAQILPNQLVIYDCMDHHGGFADNSHEVLAREHELMREADLLVVTSDWLDQEAAKYNAHRLMIRNACQYEHFARRSERVFRDPHGRKIIGYYGAIAEWFDLDLLEKVAKRFSDCLVLMVGADTCGARERLRSLDNVEFTGEVAYADLPGYLEGFDVCLLPFQIIPLTLATNPVKVYEYLSAGKEVVSIDLPELHQFGNLVRTAVDHAAFIEAVTKALEAPQGKDEISRRQIFAAGQTWAHRVSDLLQGIEDLKVPRVSVVVVAYNNIELTRACLHSLEQYSDYANLEIIVVDNASIDGTPGYLETWQADGDCRKIILNGDNRGFAAANNQGLQVATGEYLVMLNNDTFVTPGWVATMTRHLRRFSTLGMLGPVTNNIGNEARIDVLYDSMEQMLEVARDYTHSHAGCLTSLRTAAFFCVMMRREVYEKVGMLDEAFGVGFFEDDDYCRRVERAGWLIACADDVFVHHNLSASFNQLKQEIRQALFEKNKAIYEAKWGAWIAHGYRKDHHELDWKVLSTQAAQKS